jgi:hypothetical protein
MRGYLLIGLLLACVSFSPAIAWADVEIFVDNPSFETLPSGGLNLDSCGPGCSYSVAPISGWTITPGGGDVGQFQPGPGDGNFAYFNYVPDGLTVAYSDGGMISQTVGATVVNGDSYTLTVDLGNRLDGYDDAGSAGLQIGNAVYVPATGIEATPGNWTPWTATFTGTLATAGDSITIQLNAAGAQGDFDNVSLTAPEPTAVLLLSVMGGLLLALLMCTFAPKSLAQDDHSHDFPSTHLITWDCRDTLGGPSRPGEC